jgi:Holliday junction resolvase RusA-like endonuclease
VTLTPWSLRLGEQLVGAVYLGEPVPKGRPLFNRKTGNTYTPKITRDAETRLRKYLERYRLSPLLEEPLVVWLTFWSTARKPPDRDNLEKLVMDAGVGMLWVDDNPLYVPEGHTRVFPNQPNPRTEIVVSRMPR